MVAATRYNRGMSEATLPLPPELWAMVPAPVQPPLMEQWVTLRLENAALRAQNVALHERVRGLEARLGQDSSNEPIAEVIAGPEANLHGPANFRGAGEPWRPASARRP